MRQLAHAVDVEASDQYADRNVAVEYDPADLIDTDLDRVREIVSLPVEKAELALRAWKDENGCTDDGIRLAAEMFRVCLIDILEARDPKQAAWVWATAAGMECTMGVDMGVAARRFRVSKQFMCRCVNERVDRFGLSRNGHLHSDEYRAVHRRSKSAMAEHGVNQRGGRIRSVESIAARFIGWFKSNQCALGLSSWSTERLERVRSVLRPIVDLWQEAGNVLEGRR